MAKPKLKRAYRYYDILGLDEGATIENIKQAYRLIIKKYHPDINKEDSRAAEITRKLNEAYQVLSNAGKRLKYDNSEAECPKCWTHEVRRSKGNDLTSFTWRCIHCGCNFDFVTQQKETKKTEPTTEYEEYICPRCRKPLIIDKNLGLYRCQNQTCKSIFSRYELKKYYSNSIRHKQSTEKSNNQPQSKITKQQTKKEANKPFVFSSSEKLVLKGIFGISALATLSLTYYLIFSFSLLSLGLFLILLAFTILSWYIHKHPNIIPTIKSLVTMKYQDGTDE